jgi:formamidopyrimidine-DNA glycosylase
VSQSILLHLGMSGTGAYSILNPKTPAPHEHVVFHMLDDGKRCRDTSTHAVSACWVLWKQPHEEDTYRAFAKMGPEPLGNQFTPANAARCR